MKQGLTIALILLISLFYSCKNEPEIIILTTSSDILSLKPTNGSQTLLITSNSEWNITINDSWCSLSDTTGTGNKEIVIFCNDNLTELSRQTTVTINSGNQSKSVIIKQNGGIKAFDENFTDNAKNWGIKNDTLAYNLINGFYNIKNTTNSTSYFIGTKSMTPDFTGNYQISLRYLYVSGTNPFGFTFANKNSENFYRFLAYPNGNYNVIKRSNDLSTTIISAKSTAITNDNSIRLLKLGTHCEIYVNNSLIDTFELTTPFGSYVGFYSCPQTEIDVDYITVIQY